MRTILDDVMISATPNRTAELPNREFATQNPPPFSKRRSLGPVAPILVGLSGGTSETISDSEISMEKQGTSWRSEWKSNSRSGWQNLPLNSRQNFPLHSPNSASEKISRLRCWMRVFALSLRSGFRILTCPSRASSPFAAMWSAPCL